MLRSCGYCGRIHDAKYDCGRKPKRMRMKYDTDQSEFRRKQAWTKMSRLIRDRDNYLCQICLRNMYMTSKTLTYNALSVHHIVPLAEDPTRALDPANLITLCPLHHELAEDGTITRKELSQIAQEQQERTQ